jgi:hypothetical protein
VTAKGSWKDKGKREEMGRIVIRTLGRIAVSKIHRREEWNLQTNSCKQRARHAGRERERERERGRDVDCWLPASQRSAKMLS